MKAYYQDESAVIYHGDCRDILPGLAAAQLCLTDPPYVLNDSPPGKSDCGMSLEKFESTGFTDLVGGFDSEGVFRLISATMDKFNLFCFCSNKQIAELMSWGHRAGFPTALLVWHKPNAAPFANGVWRGDAEFCIHIREPGATFQGNAELKRKVYTHPIIQNGYHPTEKPLVLVSRYIQIGSNEGDTIVDPYMGSGTTLVAAKNIGRKSIGIETEEKYCEIAATRLRQGVLNLGT